MRKDERNQFYMTPEWRTLRRKVFGKYGRRCMRCRAVPRNHRHLHVDHIKPLSKHPELALDFDNLQVLCRDCNNLKSDKWVFDFRPKPNKQVTLGMGSAWHSSFTSEEVKIAVEAVNAYRREQK